MSIMEGACVRYRPNSTTKQPNARSQLTPRLNPGALGHMSRPDTKNGPATKVAEPF